MYTVELKRSETMIQSTYDKIKIEKANSLYFIECNIEIKNEEGIIQYNYNIDNLLPVSELKTKTKKEKYQFLLSLMGLQSEYEKFFFTLDPDNLYFDYNMNVKVLHRDLITDENPINIDYINAYRSMYGFLFTKHNYNDLLLGGESLMSNHDDCKEIMGMNLEKIQVHIQNKLSLIEEISSDMVFISSKKKSIWKLSTVIISLLLVALIGLSVYDKFVVIAGKDVTLEATSSFFDSNYSDVIDDLSKISTETLNNNEVYILSLSYIRTSGLSKEAISVATSQISHSGNQEYSEFWVRLGRKEFEEAYEIANKFLDKRLMYFAYSVELNSLEIDTTLSVEDKSARKKELTTLIEEYITEVEGIKEDSQSNEGGN